jgi:hypothetical protein
MAWYEPSTRFVESAVAVGVQLRRAVVCFI